MSLDALIGRRIDSTDLIRIMQTNAADQISYYNQLKKIPNLDSNVPENISTEGDDILIRISPDGPQSLISSITKIIALLNKFKAVPLKKLQDQRLPNSIALYEKAFGAIVKENERMTVSAQTKAGEPVFDFAYPEFNNTVSTKGREWGYQTVNLYPEILTDFVPLSDIDAGLVSSVEKWREENLPNACQRDYFCYGMSKDNPDSGSFTNSIREQLYRFRLSPSLYCTIADQDGDPTLSEMKEFVGKNNVPTWQQLKEMAWSDGAYEFNFQFYSGKENTAGTLMASPHFTVFGKNAFELTQVQEKYLHQTWFQKGIYQYSFEPEDLISKWIYPEEKYYLPEWDISSCSNNLFITVYEVDGDEKISLTKSVTYSYSHNFKNSFSAEYTGKKFKISFGTSSETPEQKTESSTITTEYTKGSDDLGLGKLEYTQKILNQPDNNNDTDGYSAVSVNIAGSVIVTLLPCNISK